MSAEKVVRNRRLQLATADEVIERLVAERAQLASDLAEAEVALEKDEQ